MSAQFTKANGVEWETFDSEAVLVSVEAEKAWALNRTATYVWECCDGRTTVRAIAERLASESGKSASELESEVQGFCEEMSRRGLLQPERPVTSDPSRPEAVRFQAPYVAPVIRHEECLAMARRRRKRRPSPRGFTNP